MVGVHGYRNLFASLPSNVKLNDESSMVMLWFRRLSISFIEQLPTFEQLMLGAAPASNAQNLAVADSRNTRGDPGMMLLLLCAVE